jgi:hypothetical protein
MLRARGPECPKCGCPTNLTRAGESGGPWCLFECDFCGGRVQIGRLPAPDIKPNGRIPYITVRCRCPHCNAANPTVVNTAGRTRYHKCQKCGESSISDEV